LRGAILDDGEIEGWGEIRDQLGGVLEADRQAARMRGPGQPEIEGALVVGRDLEAGFIC
jgi:hypothetical protein